MNHRKVSWPTTREERARMKEWSKPKKEGCPTPAAMTPRAQQVAHDLRLAGWRTMSLVELAEWIEKLTADTEKAKLEGMRLAYEKVWERADALSDANEAYSWKQFLEAQLDEIKEKAR